MTDLYLIVHKVHGKPAFDIAEHMTCPLCYTDQPLNDGCLGSEPATGCVECDNLGYWWTIPTIGHRAYPWWNMELYEFVTTMDGLPYEFYNMPLNWPDHYGHSTAPRKDRLAALLATLPPVPVKPFKRRF